jgi:hypothetical protein
MSRVHHVISQPIPVAAALVYYRNPVQNGDADGNGIQIEM